VFTLFYAAQGIPIALLTVAMPGWLVAQGVPAAKIATLVSVTGLPWGFKLVAGPFMDRFSFAPMGFRRPWVMAAQGGLTLSMLGLCVVSDATTQFWTIVVIGFLINTFAALQDVAVDGMAIDLLPERERGRANAFMAFGQVAGYSVFGALNGWLLVAYGIPLTAAISALFIALVFALVAVVRERPGERTFPWSSGQATPRPMPPAGSFKVIFSDLIRVFFLPMSLILTAAEFLSRMGAAVALTVFPLIAVQDLGFSSDKFALWISMASAASALVGIVFGPLVDRYGAKYLLLSGMVLSLISVLVFALSEPLWQSSSFVATSLFLTQLAGQMAFVAAIAGFMTICWTKIAATQFAVYMSLANLARSVGAGLYALLAVHLSNVDALYLIVGLNAAAVGLLLFLDLEGHKARIDHMNSHL